MSQTSSTSLAMHLSNFLAILAFGLPAYAATALWRPNCGAGSTTYPDINDNFNTHLCSQVCQFCLQGDNGAGTPDCGNFPECVPNCICVNPPREAHCGMSCKSKADCAGAVDEPGCENCLPVPGSDALGSMFADCLVLSSKAKRDDGTPHKCLGMNETDISEEHCVYTD